MIPTLLLASLLAADAAPTPPATVEAPAPLVAPPGARAVADASLVLRSDDPGARTLGDIVGDEEAENIRRINATPGTYQSYLLYTSEDLPDVFFHPGFVFTLPPPRKKEAALRLPPSTVAPAPAPTPAPPTPAGTPAKP